MGRPAKPDDEKLRERVQVLMTADDLARIQEAVDLTKPRPSLSEFFRRAGLNAAKSAIRKAKRAGKGGG